jgi:acyl-CoA hydrolase
MEIFLDVWAEDTLSGEKTKCNEAIYTFVAVSKLGKPVKVPTVKPETEIEQERFDGALRRRQLSLILGGKMQAEDSTELKALFSKK